MTKDKDILPREPTGRTFMTVRQLSDALGIPQGVIRDEIRAGRLRAFLPHGRQRGIVVAREWAKQWIDEGGRRIA